MRWKRWPATRALVMAAATVLLAGSAWCAPRLVWDPNPPEEDVTSYVVYWGTTSRHAPEFSGYDESRETGATELALPLPEDIDATYFAAVVARSASGLSSDYSTEVTIDVGNPSTTGAGGGGGGGGGCFLGLLSGEPVQAYH